MVQEDILGEVPQVSVDELLSMLNIGAENLDAADMSALQGALNQLFGLSGFPEPELSPGNFTQPLTGSES